MVTLSYALCYFYIWYLLFCFVRSSLVLPDCHYGLYACTGCMVLLPSPPMVYKMNKAWNILCWNIRAINSDSKWDALRNKIDESACSVFCLQETKRNDFDTQYIKKFAPKRFDRFDFIPWVGSSGGILVAWISTVFDGLTMEKKILRYHNFSNGEE